MKITIEPTRNGRENYIYVDGDLHTVADSPDSAAHVVRELIEKTIDRNLERCATCGMPFKECQCGA